jgi:hypothetical protein
VAELVAVADEHVQDRHLLALRRLGEQPVPFAAVLAGLAGKTGVSVCRQRG